MTKFIQKISQFWYIKPSYMFLSTFIMGGGLIPFSFFINVAIVMDTSLEVPRQVGFIYAFNWSVIYGIAFPLYVLAQFSFQTEIRRLIDRLGRWGMILDSKGQPGSEQEIRESWQQILLWVTIAWLITSFFLTIILIREFYLTVYMPMLYYGDVTLVRTYIPELTLDWSHAALFKDDVDLKLNFIFAIYAYFVQFVAISFLSNLAWFSIAFGAFLNRHSRSNSNSRLIPNFRMMNERMGLGAFGNIINYLILLYTATFGLIFLSRLWKLYLNSDFTSSMDFIKNEINEFLLPSTLNELPKIIPNYFFIGASETYSEAFTFTFSMIGGCISICFAIFMIPISIHRGRRLAIRKMVEETTFDSAQNSPELLMESIRRLESLSDWPVDNPKRNQILAYSLFLILSIVFYRLAFIYLLILIFIVIKHTSILIDDYVNSNK